MAQEVTNFARFYALFNKLPYHGDREEFKKQIVLQYTWNRTDSLKEMTAKEYEVCCTALEKLSGQDEWRQKLREELRRKRSVCLKLMQQLGIDTTDWNRVNEFCNNPRIAGKPFVQVSTAELEQLAIKLRAIQRKGGLTDKYSNMDKKAHEALERIRKDVTLTTSDMENQDAAEFFNELADWAYANGEAMLIDDEPEKQDDYEDR